jgi:hypothetical protein
MVAVKLIVVIHVEEIHMIDIEIRGHEFTFLGTKPHIRQDGTLTELHHWAKQCENPSCAQRWTFKTAARTAQGITEPPTAPTRHYSGEFTRVLCRHHRPRKKRAKSLTKRQTKPNSYTSRQTITDAEITQMRELALQHVGPKMALYRALAMAYPCTWATAREIVKGRSRSGNTAT